ncbi:hypothetical protein B0G71_5857 [Paraburkholderia sp. BL27I4N3]|nr:hypothetical protein B0G71_5857 [Paraburkholderia sp. BL27I4N3]
MRKPCSPAVSEPPDTRSSIAGLYDCPQPTDWAPYQDTVTVADLRHKGFYDGLLPVMQCTSRDVIGQAPSDPAKAAQPCKCERRHPTLNRRSGPRKSPTASGSQRPFGSTLGPTIHRPMKSLLRRAAKNGGDRKVKVCAGAGRRNEGDALPEVLVCVCAIERPHFKETHQLARYCQLVEGRAGKMYNIRTTNLCGNAIQHRIVRYGFPHLERLLAGPPFLLRVLVVAAVHEQVAHLSMDRRESLQMARRLEAPHHLLAHACGLVRILHPVVQSYVPPMLGVQAQFVLAAA